MYHFGSPQELFLGETTAWVTHIILEFKNNKKLVIEGSLLIGSWESNQNIDEKLRDKTTRAGYELMMEKK